MKGTCGGHESYDREDLRGSTDRSFGTIFSVALGLIGLLPVAFGSDVRARSLHIGAAFRHCIFCVGVPLA